MDQSHEWRDVVGFPGYRVREDGHVTGIRGDLKQKIDRKGYRSVVMFRDGRQHKRAVQRLVAGAFIGHRPTGHVVRHRNGDNTHNHWTNLCYGSRSENEADKRVHGTALLGERHHQAKLSGEQVCEIRRRHQPWSKSDGGRALSKEFGVCEALIIKIVKRGLWSHL